MGRFKRGRGTPHHPYAEPEQIDFCFQIINKMWLNKGLRRSDCHQRSHWTSLKRVAELYGILQLMHSGVPWPVV